MQRSSNDLWYFIPCPSDEGIITLNAWGGPKDHPPPAFL